MNFNKLIFLFSALIWITACGSDGIIPMESSADYRDQWEGTYVGTKSNTSRDDTMFVIDIEFEVIKDAESADGLIVNGMLFPISEDGEFGPEFIDGGEINYTVTFSDDQIYLESFGVIINGIFLPCFIKATKQ